MNITAMDWLGFPLLMLVAPCLGMLGALYIIYDLFDQQQQVLYRYVWSFSYGFLFASILLVSCLFLLSPERFVIGYPFEQVWRLLVVCSSVEFVMQVVTFSPSPTSPPDSRIDWPRLLFSMLRSGIALVAIGAIFAPQHYSLVGVALFALPGACILGAFNGFSPAIQRWVLRLPEKHIAAIGVLLIFCAFALALVQPLLSFLKVPLQ